MTPKQKIKKMKVTKLFAGQYLVKGINVEMIISNDCGYWEIEEITRGEEKINFDWMQYGTKKECVHAVNCYDLGAAK
tara:strand:- start:535 stop:765 length:231 start_codon:yes stop_codon:yes gene_type:complete